MKFFNIEPATVLLFLIIVARCFRLLVAAFASAIQSPLDEPVAVTVVRRQLERLAEFKTGDFVELRKLMLKTKYENGQIGHQHLHRRARAFKPVAAGFIYTVTVKLCVAITRFLNTLFAPLRIFALTFRSILYASRYTQHVRACLLTVALIGTDAMPKRSRRSLRAEAVLRSANKLVSTLQHPAPAALANAVPVPDSATAALPEPLLNPLHGDAAASAYVLHRANPVANMTDHPSMLVLPSRDRAPLPVNTAPAPPSSDNSCGCPIAPTSGSKRKRSTSKRDGQPAVVAADIRAAAPNKLVALPYQDAQWQPDLGAADRGADVPSKHLAPSLKPDFVAARLHIREAEAAKRKLQTKLRNRESHSKRRQNPEIRATEAANVRAVRLENKYPRDAQRPALPSFMPRDKFFEGFSTVKSPLPATALLAAMSGRTLFDDYRAELIRNNGAPLKSDTEKNLVNAIWAEGNLTAADIVRLLQQFRAGFDPDTKLNECASCGIAEYSFDNTKYYTRTLADCGQDLTSQMFHDTVEATPAEWRNIRTFYTHNGVHYALHPDIVRSPEAAAAGGVAISPEDITFDLCKRCNDANGAGV